MKKILFISIFTLLFLIPIFSLEAVKDYPIETNNDLNKAEITSTLERINNDFQIFKVFVDPQNQAINAIGLFLNFSTSSLKILNIDLNNSFCKFIIINNFNNELGHAEIMCGLPNPGVKEKVLVGQILFKSLGNNSEIVDISKNSMVLANDGYGTNVLGKINKLSFIN